LTRNRLVWIGSMFLGIGATVLFAITYLG